MALVGGAFWLIGHRTPHFVGARTVWTRVQTDHDAISPSELAHSDRILRARHRGDAVPRHRVARTFGYAVLALTLGARPVRRLHLPALQREPHHPRRRQAQLGETVPTRPRSRGRANRSTSWSWARTAATGAGNNIDGLTGGGQRSDTTILFHLSADRKNAYGVSLPRDAMVQRPDCLTARTATTSPAASTCGTSRSPSAGRRARSSRSSSSPGSQIDHFVVARLQRLQGHGRRDRRRRDLHPRGRRRLDRQHPPQGRHPRGRGARRPSTTCACATASPATATSAG